MRFSQHQERGTGGCVRTNPQSKVRPDSNSGIPSAGAPFPQCCLGRVGEGVCAAAVRAVLSFYQAEFVGAFLLFSSKTQFSYVDFVNCVTDTF